MISINASIFLGMHCHNNSCRIYCKNLVVNFLFKGIVISCEEVGKCDNMIWSNTPDRQYEYFLFMDALMTEGKFQRYAYNPSLIESSYRTKVPLSNELARSLSIKHYTLPNRFVRKIAANSEAYFTSENLEQLYRNSHHTKFEYSDLLKLNN